MASSRKHKTLSAAELQARGAAASSRAAGAAGYAEKSAAQQAEDATWAGEDSFYAPEAQDQYAETPQPRTVSAQEANDPNRYLKMNQERRNKLPFGTAGREKNYSHANVGTGGGVGGKPGKVLDALQGGASNAAGGVAGAFQNFGWRRALKWAGRAVVGVFVAFVIFIFAMSIKMNLGVNLETRAKLKLTLPGQPYYMLLVGTDKSEERVDSGMTNYRTDSIMLARIDPLKGTVTLVSIQRDTKVELEGYGSQKINAAYTFGGAPMLIDAVSELAGVPISQYAEIDFDTFVSVVDAIGGIDVNVPIDIDDDLAEVHLKAGEQTINGAEALGLCRARHAYDSYGSGDYYRTSNQRMVLGAILKKGLSGNPIYLASLVGAASNAVSCTFTGFDIIFLGLRFIGFNMDNLMSGLEPTTSSYENGVWWEIVDEDAWSTMMSRVDQGLSPYADASEDPTSGVAGIV